MDSGWIKLHRKLMSWEWYSDSKTVHLFIHLLLKANHKDNKWKGVQLMRGQMITGRDALSKDTGISPQSIRTSLARLHDSQILTSKATNKYTIITILNYDSYQGEDDDINQPLNQQSTSNQPAINQQSTTNKKEKNLKNEKKRGFQPPSVIEVEEYCQKRKNGISPQSFINHYTSNGWMRGKTKISDWKAAVRTWEDRQKADGKGQQPKKYKKL